MKHVKNPQLFEYTIEIPYYPVYKKPETVNSLINAIADVCEKQFAGKRIGLVCRGSSGLFIATLCSVKLDNSKVIYVRKEHEQSHGNDNIENFSSLEVDVYIVVDDFIASGETIKNIIQKLEKETTWSNKIIGIAAHGCHQEEKFNHFFNFYITNKS